MNLNKSVWPIFLLLLLAASAAYAGDLPPDPGEAGMQTLAGIDSDHDGVRDDVQRWIAVTFPDSQKTRAAVTQMAKAMQLILLNAEDAERSRGHSRAAGRASFCISYVRNQILGKESDAYNLKREIEAVYLNTDARTRAWLRADSHLGGMYSVPDDLSKGCDFDPNSLLD